MSFEKSQILTFEQLLCTPAEHVVQLVLSHRRSFLAKSGAYNQVSQKHLLFGDGCDTLLYGITCHKTIDHYFVLLANAVGT